MRWNSRRIESLPLSHVVTTRQGQTVKSGRPHSSASHYSFIRSWIGNHKLVGKAKNWQVLVIIGSQDPHTHMETLTLYKCPCLIRDTFRLPHLQPVELRAWEFSNDEKCWPRHEAYMHSMWFSFQEFGLCMPFSPTLWSAITFKTKQKTFEKHQLWCGRRFGLVSLWGFWKEPRRSMEIHFRFVLVIHCFCVNIWDNFLNFITNCSFNLG